MREAAAIAAAFALVAVLNLIHRGYVYAKHKRERAEMLKALRDRERWKEGSRC